jgi:hypothetical protein
MLDINPAVVAGPYILEGIIGTAIKGFIPRDAPAWYTLAGFCVFYFVV